MRAHVNTRARLPVVLALALAVAAAPAYAIANDLTRPSTEKPRAGKPVLAGASAATAPLARVDRSGARLSEPDAAAIVSSGQLPAIVRR